MWTIGKLASCPSWLKRQYSHRFAARRVTWRPSVNRTAGSGDPRRTSPERRGQETLAERVPNGGVRRPSPNESAGKGGRGDRKAPERSQFARVLILDKWKLTTNQGEIGQAKRTQFPAGGNKTQASLR